MSASGRIELPVGGGRFIAIEEAHPGAPLDGPVYAVNLLNRRRPWAYDFYNLLALRPVRHAGARLLFKGFRTRILEGAEGQTRETLLIVRYPKAEAFLRMVRRPYFAAISLVRRFGLKDFLLGFMQRRDGLPEPSAKPPRRYRGSAVYLLYTCRGAEVSQKALETLNAAAEAAGGQLFFAGRLVGTVAGRREGKETTRTLAAAPPLPWEGVILVEGRGEEVLEAVFRSAAFEGLRGGVSQDSAAFYRRAF